MFFVGIDIAKNFHQVAVLDNDGKPIFKPFVFSNTEHGFQKLLTELVKVGINSDNALFAMEATGHYWFALYFFLTDLHYTVKVFNPIQTDAFRDISIRKVKTDIVDSVNIADLLRFGKYSECIIPDENTIALRNLSRFRFSMVDLCGDLKRKVICLLDQVFPEYDKLFSDIFGITSKQLLLKFSTPEEFENVSLTKLSKFISKVSKGRLGKAKAQDIKTAAMNSIGLSFALDSFSFQIKQLIEQIDFTEKQIAEIDTELAKLLNSTNYSVVTTITGIGATLGSVIVGEIGDINRFESAPKLVAYAGLDASVKQSGNFIGTQNKISKRGSPYLRRALWTAAFIASQKDPVLSVYYTNLITRGKSHRLAITAVSRKLCNIVWAVLKSGKPYVPKA